jgi:type II secretory pathway pseudopilin PulG
MAKVQFRLRSLIIAVIIIALLLALGIQSVRVQQLQARAEQAAAEAMRARAMAELAAQRAATQLRPDKPAGADPGDDSPPAGGRDGAVDPRQTAPSSTRVRRPGDAPGAMGSEKAIKAKTTKLNPLAKVAAIAGSMTIAPVHPVQAGARSSASRFPSRAGQDR